LHLPHHVDLLFGWRKGFGNHRAPFARNLAPLCLMRTIRRLYRFYFWL